MQRRVWWWGLRVRRLRRGRVEKRHWRTELKKQVLPRLGRGEGKEEEEEEEERKERRESEREWKKREEDG